MLSPRSVKSTWVRAEVRWAFAKREGRIIPILIEACDPFELHLRLNDLQFIDLRQGTADALRRLLEALSVTAKRSAAVSPVRWPAERHIASARLGSKVIDAIHTPSSGTFRRSRGLHKGDPIQAGSDIGSVEAFGQRLPIMLRWACLFESWLVDDETVVDAGTAVALVKIEREYAESQIDPPRVVVAPDWGQFLRSEPNVVDTPGHDGESIRWYEHNPAALPLARIGDRVRKGHRLGWILNGGRVNDVVSSRDGIVRAIFAEDGEEVTQDQPLFQIVPR